MAARTHADDQVVVSVLGFADCTDGVKTVAIGQRLRADNPLVKRHPDWFVRDGADSLEITRARQLIETADLAPEVANPFPTQIVKPMRDEDAMVCIGGRFSGERFHRKSPQVKADPSRFVDVVPPGLARSDALVALETMIQFADDGTARKLHKGQWCARTDPLVQLHPQMFAMPAIEED